jgi:hypothetical protein
VAWGVIKHINERVFRWFFNGGAGTNTKVELLAAWAFLIIGKALNIH